MPPVALHADQQIQRTNNDASLVRAIRKGCAAAGIHPPTTTMLVLCSGGPDSIALADVLANMPRGARPRAMELVWFDHGLRDTSTDEACARALAGKINVPLQVVRAEGALGRSGDAGNLHDRARAWRYAETARILNEQAFGCAVTAHHADDIAEGVLLGLARGGGLRAVAAMEPLVELPTECGTATIVRPLLSTSRAALQAHCDDAGLAYVSDPANADEAFGRSRVRHTVLPELQKVHPAAMSALTSAAIEARMTAGTIDALAKQVLATADCSVELLSTLPTSAAHAVAAEWLRQHNTSAVTRAAIEALVRAACRTAGDGCDRSIDVPGAQITVSRAAVRYSALRAQARATGAPHQQGAPRAR